MIVGNMMDMGGMMGAGMIWAVLILLLLAAGAAAVIVLAVRAGRQGRAGQRQLNAGSDEAHSVLRRRFAAGEIDDEEYQRRRAALDNDR